MRQIKINNCQHSQIASNATINPIVLTIAFAIGLAIKPNRTETLHALQTWLAGCELVVMIHLYKKLA